MTIATRRADRRAPVDRRGRTGAWTDTPGWDLLLICLGLVLLTFVWRIQHIFPVLATLQVTSVAYLGSCALFILDRDPRRRLRHIRNPVTWAMLGIFGMMVLSLPTSLHSGGSYGFITRDHVRTLIFVLILAASLRTMGDVEKVALLHVLGALVTSIFFLLRYGPEAHIGWGYDNNSFAMVLVCSIPLMVYFLRSGANWVFRIIGAAALVFALRAIVVGESRAGFLGLIAVGVYLILKFSSLSKRLRLAAAALGVVAVVAVSSDSYYYNWVGGSEVGRMEIWRRGLGYMAARPLLGVGVGRFGDAEGRLASEAERQQYGRGWKWSTAHNSFVQIGAELGVPGLLLLLALLWYSFRMLRRSKRLYPSGRVRGPDQAAMSEALIGTLLGYLVVGFFLSQAYSAYMHTIYAMIIGIAKVSDPRVAPGLHARSERTPLR